MDMTEAILLWQDSRASNGLAVKTRRNETLTLERLARYMHQFHDPCEPAWITGRDVDDYFDLRRNEGVKPSVLNLELANLRAFFKHARSMGWVGPDFDPTSHRRQQRLAQAPRLRIPASEFPRLLDAAENPRDRMVVALGIYLLLRESEIRLLRVGDVHLRDGFVSVMIPKSDKHDEMPISSELDLELTKYLGWMFGGLNLIPWDVEQPLIPALESSGVITKRPYVTPHRSVQKTLERAGYPIRDTGDRSTHEGSHTLRRSGARALFDELSSQGVDRALRYTQAMLHHSSIAVTERYVGLDADRRGRDELLRGRRMYTTTEESA